MSLSNAWHLSRESKHFTLGKQSNGLEHFLDSDSSLPDISQLKRGHSEVVEGFWSLELDLNSNLDQEHSVENTKRVAP